ncbi:MAG: N-acetyl-gamma-glutamyl-phosphate reductase [Planctomycetes bacterium]|nr:N-acetyl-gamma-glutamyl-phosphate reductase [Planctomycetota bacterium]MCB9903653.1 N-acetyl-gamma-glutamyl-phosphate reductase [Planctomycetota bacterium]
MDVLTSSKRIAVVGATGYAGGELCKLVAAHGGMQLASAMSARSEGGARVARTPGEVNVDAYTPELFAELDGVFVCAPHGASAPVVLAALEAGAAVVDLSADFRLSDPSVYESTYGLPHPAPELLSEAVYGLTEHARDAVAATRLVANPGCYPTSILLPLLPLFEHGLVSRESLIVADSKSGLSGAGKGASDRTHFGNVHENFLAYGVGTHRHTPEIHQHAGTDSIRFVPHLLPVERGILSTIYVQSAGGVDAEAIRSCLSERYADEPFVHVRRTGLPELKDVQRTNRCDMAVCDADGTVVIVSVLDNLLKGAAGQALQNMNLMLGLPEAEGVPCV